MGTRGCTFRLPGRRRRLHWRNTMKSMERLGTTNLRSAVYELQFFYYLRDSYIEVGEECTFLLWCLWNKAGEIILISDGEVGSNCAILVLFSGRVTKMMSSPVR